MGAQWAMMPPVYKVLDLAAIPYVFEDKNDALRMWERMRTMVAVTITRCLPDSIFQMGLQARFLGLAFPSIDWSLKFQLCLNVVLCLVAVVPGSLDMVVLNR